MASTSAPSSTRAELSLRADGLGFRYADGTDALSGVSFALGGGRVVALTGDNGSGKSTLLKLCAGRVRPSRGQVVLEGTHHRVGYAAQDPELDPDMTGLEHLRLWCALERVPPTQGKARIASLVEAFRLTDFVMQRVSSFSGGMKRRLHLALSAVNEPMLWLLDEPSAGLDAQTERSLWRLVRERAQAGALVLVATHAERVLDGEADEELRLAAGQRA